MWTLPILLIVTAVTLSIPVGFYLAWIMDGKYKRLRLLAWIERRLDGGPQNWKQYAMALLLFNGVMFVVGFVCLSIQHLEFLSFLNPGNKGMLAPTTIFNTAISFLTNTNLQHISGEQHLSYFSQLTAIMWNMFVSASVGFCALSAVIRGLRSDAHMGNYYLDMWRAVVYIFLPSCLIMGVLLLADGVPMTFEGAAQVDTLEPGAMVDAKGVQTKQEIARGPVAAVIPIKQLGTNGGGFFGANGAHPYESPSAWSNFLLSFGMMIFPFSLVVMFGRMLKNMPHAVVVYGVMMFMFVGMIGWAIYWDTLQPNPGLVKRDPLVDREGHNYQIDLYGEDGKVLKDKKDKVITKPVETPSLAALPIDHMDMGNLEGKELRFGPSAGATFSAMTTCVTCGSVNCMHDSLNPLAGLSPFTGMWLNCIFGGKGVGIINLLVYLIVGVFLAGLMVGRTPEYLGKKVEAREMKLAMLALLIHPILILGPAGLFAACDWGMKATNNPGPHGFSEILYEFSSASANNGSGFEGLHDTWGYARTGSGPKDAPERTTSPPWDIATGLVMLFSRFIPIIAPLASGRRSGGQETDAVHRGHLADRYVDVCFRLAGNDPAGRRTAVPAGRDARPGRRASRTDAVWRLR